MQPVSQIVYARNRGERRLSQKFPEWAAILTLAAIAILAGCNKAPNAGATAQPADQTGAANASNSVPFSQNQPQNQQQPQSQNAAGNPANGTPDGSAGYANSSAGGNAQAQPSQVVDTVTIPAGTPITVRLQTALSSASNQPGDRFDAVLERALVVKGSVVARAGAPVVGRVIDARPSGRLEHPGMLQIALKGVNIDGRMVPIATSSVTAVGASHKKRNLAMIGGGGGGGALLGGLFGGGKGALIGGLAGAGAGTGAAYATGKKDVSFGTEHSLTFKLSQTVVVQ